jgi:hypothetical protein
MLKCQIVLKKSDYHFLFTDSYLDCAQLYPFDDTDMVLGIGDVLDSTKVQIKEVVSTAQTIAKNYRDLILSS